MTTTTTSSKATTIGYIVQLGGIAAFTLGAIFSVHPRRHRRQLLSAGAAAFYVGEKLRTLA